MPARAGASAGKGIAMKTTSSRSGANHILEALAACLLVSLAATPAAHAQVAQAYTLTDLGALGASNLAGVSALDNSGHAVGTSTFSNQTHATLWMGGGAWRSTSTTAA